MVHILKAGEVVARSKNLRGVLDYARKHACERVDVNRRGTMAAESTFYFSDGAMCKVSFASFVVARRFVGARRSWALTTIVRNSDDWYVYLQDASTRYAARMAELTGA